MARRVACYPLLSGLAAVATALASAAVVKVKVQAADIDGLRVSSDTCSPSNPCPCIGRGSALRVVLTGSGYASAFLQDRWGKYFNQEGRWVVANAVQGDTGLWPGTDREISHQTFKLWIVTSTSALPRFPDTEALEILPSGENGETWGPIYLSVKAGVADELYCFFVVRLAPFRLHIVIAAAVLATFLLIIAFGAPSVRNNFNRLWWPRRRVKSFSLWGFGVSWDYLESEAETVRKLIVLLEDRSILYDPMPGESPTIASKLVEDIRSVLDRPLNELPASSRVAPLVRAMQRSCRDFLRVAQPEFGEDSSANMTLQRALFDAHLGAFRGVFLVYLAVLVRVVGVEVRGELKDALPVLD